MGDNLLTCDVICKKYRLFKFLRPVFWALQKEAIYAKAGDPFEIIFAPFDRELNFASNGIFFIGFAFWQLRHNDTKDNLPRGSGYVVQKAKKI